MVLHLCAVEVAGSNMSPLPPDFKNKLSKFNDNQSSVALAVHSSPYPKRDSTHVSIASVKTGAPSIPCAGQDYHQKPRAQHQTENLC